MPERFRLISAVHLFLIRQEKILLLRRFNTGWGDGLLSVVAGHLEGGEEVKAAAIREAREEVGIAVGPNQLTVVGVMHRREGDERIDFFLTAGDWEGDVRNCEPARCSELQWTSLRDLPADLIPYVRQAIENYRRGDWFQSYGWGEAGTTNGPGTRRGEQRTV